jgi:hypothetical protein
MMVDRRSSDLIAQLRPIPNTDRFELFLLSQIQMAAGVRLAISGE